MRRLGPVLFFLLVIPGGLALLSGMPPAMLPALALTTFLLQAGAAGSGAVGSHGVANLLVVTSFGLGYILAEFEVLDRLSRISPRISRWVEGVSQRAAEIRFLPHLGIFLVLPLMWMPGIGLYGGVVVAWVLRWDRLRSFIVLAAGWMMACGAVYLLVGQFLNLLKG
jgi:uncharacterized membrane protein